MKKITNNAMLGNITVLFNLLIFVLVVVSMVLLMKFDKINVRYVEATPVYEKVLDDLRTAQQPTRLDSATVAHYQYRMDTLKAKPTPKNTKDAKALNDEIKRVNDLLVEKIELKEMHDSIVLVKQAQFAPVESNYKELEDGKNAAHKTFSLLFTLCFVLLIVKIFFFAYWNYKNSNNIHNAVNWAKKGTAPYWSFVGWIIPVYNLIKPYTVFSETWNDTEYLLKDRAILPEDYDKKDNNDFYIGLWWGLLLIAVCLCTLFINGTFFNTGALFVKLSHANVAIVTAVFWALYLCAESFVIFRFNKLNKLMVDNQDKI